MTSLFWFACGVVLGGVGAVLIYRNNMKRIEGQIAELQSIVDKLKKK